MAKDYRDHLRDQLGAMKSVTASEAKNQFGQVLETALRDGAVVITKHDTPKAVLLSMEEFESMTKTRTKLDTLRTKWDVMYSDMQRSEVRAAAATAFDATPRQLAAAATKAARTKR